jgi:hypothetical protein
MAGKASPRHPSISRLTSQLDPIPSVARRLRRAKFQPHHGRHHQEQLTTMNFSVAAIIGAVAATGLYWVLWQVEHPAMAEEPPKTNNPPPVSVSGNNNVVSIGQTGGVTAGTYINQVPQPELKLIEQKDVVNPDGTHTTTFTVDVVSQLTPAYLAIEIEAQGILSAGIMPPPTGGVAMMQLRNVRRSPEAYHAEMTSPRGRYFVTVSTIAQTPIKLNYQF